ncbi:firmicute plasmid replication family protein [Clostridioides difficile DA00165]|nr:firmicute plasmid replication family protein [Clostridioides difficile DA00165]
MDFLQRVKNGEYMINPHIAYKGSRADKESLLAEYNQIKDLIRLVNKEEGFYMSLKLDRNVLQWFDYVFENASLRHYKIVH